MMLTVMGEARSGKRGFHSFWDKGDGSIGTCFPHACHSAPPVAFCFNTYSMLNPRFPTRGKNGTEHHSGTDLRDLTTVIDVSRAHGSVSEGGRICFFRFSSLFLLLFIPCQRWNLESRSTVRKSNGQLDPDSGSGKRRYSTVVTCSYPSLIAQAQGRQIQTEYISVQQTVLRQN